VCVCVYSGGVLRAPEATAVETNGHVDNGPGV
jgi:hypothetical protein